MDESWLSQLPEDLTRINGKESILRIQFKESFGRESLQLETSKCEIRKYALSLPRQGLAGRRKESVHSRPEDDF